MTMMNKYIKKASAVLLTGLMLVAATGCVDQSQGSKNSEQSSSKSTESASSVESDASEAMSLLNISDP